MDITQSVHALLPDGSLDVPHSVTYDKNSPRFTDLPLGPQHQALVLTVLPDS